MSAEEKEKPTAILTKILGVTSSWTFATDTLTGFFQKNLANFLESNWDNEDIVIVVQEMRKEAKKMQGRGFEAPSIADESAGKNQILTSVVNYVKWYSKNIPVTPESSVNLIQGLIWGNGFKTGAFKTHFFPDVIPCLQLWKSKGMKLYTMSSGSVAGQEAYFAYSDSGNYSQLINGYIGLRQCGLDKYQVSSYGKLASIINTPRLQVAFITSSVREARAAMIAGLNVYFIMRPDNPRINPTDIECFNVIQSFKDLAF